MGAGQLLGRVVQALPGGDSELNELDANADIAVLGVNFDGIQGQDLINLGEKMGIEFTMLAEDPGPEFGWKLPVALPATFVVKPDGELLEARFGPQTEEQLRELIGQHQASPQ